MDKEKAILKDQIGKRPLSRAEYVRNSIEDNAERMTGRRTDFRRKSEFLSKM